MDFLLGNFRKIFRAAFFRNINGRVLLKIKTVFFIGQQWLSMDG